VQHLQKVLAKKRDPVTHVCFLEELNQNRNTHLVQRFWTEVTGLLTQEFNRAANGKNGVSFYQINRSSFLSFLSRILSHQTSLRSGISEIVENVGRSLGQVDAVSPGDQFRFRQLGNRRISRRGAKHYRN
jgi:hypothetical protein